MAAVKAFKYRLYPTPTQQRRMRDLIYTRYRMWNLLIAIRKAWMNPECMRGESGVEVNAWADYDLLCAGYEIKRSETRKSPSYNDNCAIITHIRKLLPWAKDVPVTVLRAPAKDLKTALEAFYKRLKEDNPVSIDENGKRNYGEPGFKPFKTQHGFGFTQANSFRIDGRRLYMQNIGRVPVFWHKPIEGEIKTARVTYEARSEWYVSFQCEIPESPLFEKTGRVIGIDRGIHHEMATSDGQFFENPRPYARNAAKLRTLKRKIDRQERAGNPDCYDEKRQRIKGKKLIVSNNLKQTYRQRARLEAKIARQRRYYLDMYVHELLMGNDEFPGADIIVLEKLQINNMVKNKKLSKHILDAAWGYLCERLKQKAKEIGAIVIEVDPRYTSQTCSQCGQRFPKKIGLSQRWVTCDCGMSLDRDVNAARNVLQRAGHALTGLTQDVGLYVPGNLRTLSVDAVED